MFCKPQFFTFLGQGRGTLFLLIYLFYNFVSSVTKNLAQTKSSPTAIIVFILPLEAEGEGRVIVCGSGIQWK